MESEVVITGRDGVLARRRRRRKEVEGRRLGGEVKEEGERAGF